MMVEIPDPWVIFGVIVAFLAGLGGLYLYYKIRPFVKVQNGADPAHAERLEYYERQLIDMKIRLDALEMQDVEQKGEDPGTELRQFLEKFAKNAAVGQAAQGQDRMQAGPEAQVPPPAMPGLEHGNAVDHVLHLITHKAMTSRDIQITLKRSREHTSRLMKKLFEDGYVQRTQTKPYAYSITGKGREKISSRAEPQSVTAA